MPRRRGAIKSYIGRQASLRNFGVVSALLLLLILVLTVCPVAFHDPATIAAGPTTNTTTLTMTTGSETASVNITVSSPSGTFAYSNNSETAKFGVTTNNYTGYTLTIAGTDDTGLLTNTDTSVTSNNTLTSISSATSADTFSSSTALNGKWGYRPSKYNSSANTSFLPAPTTTPSTLDTTATANPSTPNNYTIGVGARVDYSKPAGDYANTFVLAAVGNPVGYSIAYSDNTGDTSVANLPTTQSGTTSTTSIKLSPNKTPTRTGYNFKSWCLGTVSNNGTTCTGAEYVSGNFVDFIDQTAASNAITLYALWTANSYTVTLNGNGATNSYTTSTTATYNATTLGAIATLPARVYSVSNFTVGGTNAASSANASVSWTNASSNCKSTSACNSTYTFNGWYKEAATTNKIASNAATPALQASTAYTNASSGWTSTSNQTLYAGWTGQSITLPAITRSGSTCGWATTAGATTWTYVSGATITPTANTTLYGVCRNDITLNNSGATTAGSTSATVNYGATSLSAITVPQRKYTVSGFSLTTSGANATVSSTSTLTNTATFNGWYTASSGGTKVANNAATPALTASNGYTNGSSAWTYTTAGAITLYSQWTDNAVTLPTITRTGSTCGWATSNTATSWNYDSGASVTPTSNMTLYGVCRTNITLNANGGTLGSSSTTATYGATTLATITNPTRANSTGTKTISGFTMTASGANASVSYSTTASDNCTAANNCKSTNTTTYAFNGWYKESGTTNKIASNATTPALSASTTYTNASSAWTYTTAGEITLYAGWTATAGSYSAVKLPTITRAGSTCGWATSSTATSWDYTSGQSITPSGDMTLYGVCKTNITLDRNGGNTGSTSTAVTYGATTLDSITVPTRANSTGTRTIGGFTLATSGTNASITWPSSGCTSSSNCKSTNTTTYAFNGWYKESGATNKIADTAATPALQPSTIYTNANKQWDYTTAGTITLYAGWTATAGNYSSVTLPTIARTGSTCGWATSSTATSWTYTSAQTITPSGDMTLYGVCRTNINLNNAGATTAGSTSATVEYNAGNLSAITVPQRNYTVSGFTLTTSGTNATVSSTSTLTNTATFNGWYTASSGGTKIASNAATPALQASTTYTNASSKWTYTTAGTITLYSQWTDNAVTLPTITRTGSTCGWATSSTATSWNYDSSATITPTSNMTLYGVCRTNITLNANGGTLGSTSTTATYGATTLATITNPTRANSTGTRTVSGFSLTPSGNNATVTYSSTASDNCTAANNCKSTNTTTYAFNGWYKESGTTNKIASNATTPALSASTTYTNASSQWTYTTAGNIMLYAGWTASAGNYNTVKLPTITRAGSTCGWATGSSTATSWTYTSGQTITPDGDMTLFGVCKTNITLDRNGGNTGSTSTAVTYLSTTLDPITVPTRANSTGTRTIEFGLTNSGANASVSYSSTASDNCTAANNCKATTTLTYTFNGWYRESGATNKVADAAATPALIAGSFYTNGYKQWNYTTAGEITLYAGWTATEGSYSSVKLPTITRTGSTCGWATSSTATTWNYASGASFTPSANTTLYGVCRTNITLNNAGATTAGSTSATVNYGDTGLSTITLPERKFTISGFTLTASGANATVSSTNTLTANATFNGWFTASSGGTMIASRHATPALQSNTAYTNGSSQWTYTAASAVTLYSQWTMGTLYLPTITRTGSVCGWATSSTATTWEYTSGQSITPTANLTLYGVCRNGVALSNAGATTAGSTSATVNYGDTTLSTITVPQRNYTVSGFTLTTSGTNATVSSTSTLTNTATFNGWYTASSGGTKIASSAATPALQASTTYTNASSKWTYTTAGTITLYSQWTDNAVTLPTITRTGSTCGWSTNSSANSWTYTSGQSITPTSNMTLYGVCRTDITLDRNGGDTGSTSTTATYGATSLGGITVPTKSSTTGTRTISGFTMTDSGNNASITWPTSGCTSASNCKSTNTTTYAFNGWYKESGTTNKIASNSTTPALQASTTYTNASSQWTYTTAGAITLYAGWTASAGNYSSVKLPTITRTGSTCGWSTSSTATTWEYTSGQSITPTSSLTLYGVCRTNISLNNAGATTSGSTSTTVTYSATSLAAITVPQRSYSVSGFTLTNSGANATVSSTSTLTNNATFNGWYTASSGGTKIASGASTPALQASTTYTNASSQWTYTTAGAITLYSQWTDNAVTLPTITRTGSTCGWSTNSSANSWTYTSGQSITPTSNMTLYGVCRTDITLNANGGTLGSGSTTAVYGATGLGSITNPSRANTTGTRTVSGFTLTDSGANATVTWPTTGCTSASNCKSTNTTTYAFNGWYKESGTTNKIASNSTTPALQASTTYTNASSQWTYTTAGAITLYAGWTPSVGNYSTVKLPTITRTGSTCGWATSSTATSWTYTSAQTITPSGDMTLYGVCRTDISLNANGGTLGSTSTTAVYGATTLGTITNPTRANSTGTRTVSGFSTAYNNAANATVTYSSTASDNCTAANNCKSTNTTTYAFNGWYKESGTTNKIASNATTPALSASTTYTNASSAWTYTTAGEITLYAGWTATAGNYSSVKLPTIGKTGHTCGWTTSTSASTWDYTSGATITPSGNTTLYGVCVANTHSLTITFAGSGVSSVQVRTASGTGGTLMGTVSTSGGSVSGLTYGNTYYLYPVFTIGHSLNNWENTGSYGTLDGLLNLNPTFTMGAGDGAVKITGKIDTYNLFINFSGTGVSSVQVRTASGTGGTLMGTVSAPGGSAVSGLAYGTAYYLYPTFTSGYRLQGWMSSGAGSLSSAFDTNPTFTIGAGDGTVTIVGERDCTAISSSTTMQAFAPTSSTCDSGTLKDSRDNQTYTVAKIGDIWWMTRNLAIGCNGSGSTYGSSTKSKTLWGDTSNTMSPDSGWSTPTALLSTAANSSPTSGYTTAAMQCSSTYGAWYNYAAATAGTVTGSIQDDDAQYDICPKGWKLPNYDNINDLEYLTSNGIVSPNIFGPLGGGYYKNGTLQSSSDGYWWGTDVATTAERWNLQWYSSTNRLQLNSSDRYLGRYVRCVLDTDTPYEKLQAGRLSMQDIGNLSAADTTTLLSSMSNIGSYNSVDIRDGQIYTVAKINNKIWMTRNLALGCNGSGSTYGSSVSSKVLTSQTSNFNSLWATPTKLLSQYSMPDGTNNGYDNEAMYCSSTYGAWYNYGAASAGTIKGEDNDNTQIYDICPKGWRLPTSTEFSGIRNSSSQFSPVVGGGWDSNAQFDTNVRGYWWASTGSATYRDNFVWFSSMGSLYVDVNDRNYGQFVRCIKN